jgi:hypothetical protein
MIRATMEMTKAHMASTKLVVSCMLVPESAGGALVSLLDMARDGDRFAKTTGDNGRSSMKGFCATLEVVVLKKGGGRGKLIIVQLRPPLPLVPNHNAQKTPSDVSQMSTCVGRKHEGKAGANSASAGLH